jgi:hypothetical protein
LIDCEKNPALMIYFVIFSRLQLHYRFMPWYYEIERQS